MIPDLRALARSRPTLGVVAATVLIVALIAFWPRPDRPAATVVASPAPASPAPGVSQASSPSPSPIPVPAAPDGLPVLDYFEAPPQGFPADTETMSSVPLTLALRPTRTVAVYTAPGGTPLAYAAPTISGVPLVMPIVAQRQGWRAVILPSVNRTLGWVPPTGWEPVPLRDQLVVRLSSHELTWLRDGQVRGSWTVALGAANTPTPVGRTFVLARTSGHSSVYAGVDILALGAVPDHPDEVAAGLSDAHTGIHAWHDPSVFGTNVSNGCVRMPRDAQELLVAEVVAGTEVLVLD